MTTLAVPSPSDSRIPPGKLAYFQARLRNRLHELVLLEFLRQEKAGLTKKKLADRIGKRPEQITRWLSAPSNWTLDTVSDLLFAMGAEPELAISLIADKAEKNRTPERAQSEEPKRPIFSADVVRRLRELFSEVSLNQPSPEAPTEPYQAYETKGATPWELKYDHGAQVGAGQ